MTSDFTKISKVEYNKNILSYIFYDKDNNIIIDTYDTIFSIDPSFNQVFDIAFYNPQLEIDNKIKNLINSLVFPDKANDTLKVINDKYNLVGIQKKPYKMDIIVECDIDEELYKKEDDPLNINTISSKDLDKLLLFGCSLFINLKNIKRNLIYIFVDFMDDIIYQYVTDHIKHLRDEYGIVKNIFGVNTEIYVIDLHVISKLLIEQKDIIIRGKKIEESGRDILKFLTLNNFAYVKNIGFVVPKSQHLYKNEHVRNMMIYLNNLSYFTKSKILIDIDYYRENYSEQYEAERKREEKKTNIRMYLILFLYEMKDDKKEKEKVEVDEEIVKEIWEEDLYIKEKNKKKYEDFIKYLNEKNIVTKNN